ncbi:MAG: pentapeptide repeat-containing protein [Pseudomonadota bacterium]
MKRLVLAGLAAALLATPAMAQNRGQIAQVARGASCPGCNLFQAELTGRELGGINLSRSRLRQADLSLAVMNRASFAGADLRDVNAFGGVFGGASFAGADLTNATFVGAFLEGANFRGANLTGANFSGAEMGRASGLSQGQLDRACGDVATVLPRGLRIPACR